jgi:hypothetical protein
MSGTTERASSTMPTAVAARVAVALAGSGSLRFL